MNFSRLSVLIWLIVNIFSLPLLQFLFFSEIKESKTKSTALQFILADHDEDIFVRSLRLLRWKPRIDSNHRRWLISLHLSDRIMDWFCSFLFFWPSPLLERYAMQCAMQSLRDESSTSAYINRLVEKICIHLYCRREKTDTWSRMFESKQSNDLRLRSCLIHYRNRSRTGNLPSRRFPINT